MVDLSLFQVSPLPPSLCFSSVTLTLTSADTDQVASSQWVSMEPSNRKQVRPGAPALMLNVATEKTLCFDGVKQHQLKQPGVRRKEKIPSLFQHVQCVSVLCLRCRRGWEKLSGRYALEVIRVLLTGLVVCVGAGKQGMVDSPLDNASWLDYSLRPKL